jgi:RNA polymerase sigma factor (sigma-70 family)
VAPNRIDSRAGNRDVIAVMGDEATASAPSTIARSRAVEFAAFVEPYLTKMRHLAERLAGPAERDDVVQEALINAWTKRRQFDPARGSLGGWLMAIVADQARKARRRRLPRLVLRGGSATPNDPSADQHLDVGRAVQALPPRQRLAVDCHYFAGLTVAETAAVMSCSEGTVKSTLADARAHLRPALEDWQ